MNKGMLINDLELGYAPLSAYAFNILINDNVFFECVEDSHLYIIAQRKEITFNNFNFDSLILSFDLKQEDSFNIIKCALPIFQENIAKDKTKSVELRLHNRRNSVDKKNNPSFNKTQGISFKEVNISTGERKHLIWFSPEKLLQNYWKGYIKMDIQGDFKELLKYKVHYVGKSTEQNICQRLTNHSTFQEILSKQDVLSYGNIPSNEIVILLFRVKDNSTIVKWENNASEKEIANYLLNYSLPDDRIISLDAEKALIKQLQPEYNKILYKSFPNKFDLINKDFHDIIFYSIIDPITLIYENGSIRGGFLLDERDYISVETSK